MAVPPVVLGQEPTPRSAFERDERDFAYADAFARHYGLSVFELGIEGAERAALRRGLHSLGLDWSWVR